MANTKLARYVSMQIWSGAKIAGKAMEKLVKPMLTKPTLPSLTKEYKVSEDQEIPDPDNQGQKLTVKKQVKKQRLKDFLVLKMETDVYMLHYENWIEESCH